MENSELIQHARRLAKKAAAAKGSSGIVFGVQAEVSEFLRIYAGSRSSFYRNSLEGKSSAYVASVIDSFADFVESGLHQGISPERKGQIEAVSDILDQANTLLEDKNCHPAAAAMLIGASLEEFLRTWVESEDISLGSKKPGLDSYAKVSAGLIVLKSIG